MNSQYHPRLCLTYIPGVTNIISTIFKRLWPSVSDLFNFSLSFSYKNSYKIGDILNNKIYFPICRNYELNVDESKSIFNLNELDASNVEKCARRSCKCCDEHMIVVNSSQSYVSSENITVKLPRNNINCECSNLIYLI